MRERTKKNGTSAPKELVTSRWAELPDSESTIVNHLELFSPVSPLQAPDAECQRYELPAAEPVELPAKSEKSALHEVHEVHEKPK
jgi:hypothetical protein